ncbi:MAG: M23 family metallopeptidase [Bacillota bacterium]|nr:M23 family metallopeptidase [Bacillota bacterium]
MNEFDERDKAPGDELDRTEGIGKTDTGGAYEKMTSGYERVDGGSAYDSRRDRRRKREFRYAMVTVVCLLVAMAAIVMAVNDYGFWRGENNGTDLTGSQEQGTMDHEEGIDVIQPVPAVDSLNNEETEEEGQAREQAPAYAVPAEGSLTKDYSMDVPVYSKTLDQYVVHTGVDIEADKDSQVKAAAGGTVTAVYADDRLGNTIEIAHGDGLVSRYANLSNGVLVEVGDVVERGQVIAGVGDTALFESADPPHLHFEMLQDELPVDPNDYIDF